MLAAAVNVTVSQVRKLTREGYSHFDERCLWHAAQSGRPILVAKLEEILDSMDYSDQSISTVINTCKNTAQTVVGVAYQLGDRILSTYPGTVRVLCGKRYSFEVPRYLEVKAMLIVEHQVTSISE